ncbi:MAG TPA: transcription termination factor Rho [Mycobacteriales bacterium]|nr:transcription termination factor Rho [Mycobacteriales bacterium]
MLLPELQSLAGSLGITGTGRMRKGELVAAIQAKQSGNGAGQGSTPGQDQLPLGGPEATTSAPPAAGPADADPAPTTRTRQRRSASRPAGSPASTDEPAGGPVDTDTPAAADSARAESGPSAALTAVSATASVPTQDSARADGGASDSAAAPVTDRPSRRERERGQRDGQGRDRTDERGDRDRTDERGGRDRTDERGGRDRSADGDRPAGDRPEGDRGPRRDRNDRGDRADRAERGDRGGERGDRNDRGNRDDQRAASGGDNRDGRDGRGDNRTERADRADRDNRGNRDDDDEFDGRSSRRRGRFRDRNRRNRSGGDRFADQGEPVISEDDVLLPVAGILDILDNYAFVRTSGYLTGPNDVYVSLAQVRRHGLRRGDAITGAVRQPREGERRDKYNALVRLDTINGMDPEQAKTRPEFMKLTPLYPQERLRLETEPHLLTSRVIDLVMPIGKGQRALIVSPPKAGKTMIMQAIANAVTTNNPECHLMVVLVDERPEEVTDMQRAVKGEVIASTFDRPPTDHTTVAELSIERAKRLVELGHDVVVLLDNITRLGRAYNLAAPASGRILSGGVDSTALYPPKRFLGAARNIEHGGSLTIMATALIETGSTMDTVIFEEFKGTGNAELILSRKIANKRVFPAVDVIASGTRKEEILLAPEELVIVHKLRRVLNALDPEQAIDLLLDRLKQSRTNVEFLMQIAKSTPGQD